MSSDNTNTVIIVTYMPVICTMMSRFPERRWALSEPRLLHHYIWPFLAEWHLLWRPFQFILSCEEPGPCCLLVKPPSLSSTMISIQDSPYAYDGRKPNNWIGVVCQDNENVFCPIRRQSELQYYGYTTVNKHTIELLFYVSSTHTTRTSKYLQLSRSLQVQSLELSMCGSKLKILRSILRIVHLVTSSQCCQTGHWRNRNNHSSKSFFK